MYEAKQMDANPETDPTTHYGEDEDLALAATETTTTKAPACPDCGSRSRFKKVFVAGMVDPDRQACADCGAEFGIDLDGNPLED